MSKRNKKLKRKRAIIIVIVILILLFIAILFTKGKSSNNKVEEPTNQNTDENNDNDNNNKDKANKISDLRIIPETYVAFTGEKINLNSFKLLAISEKGEEINITENIDFSITSDIIKIENNTLVVSERSITADRGILTVNYGGMSKDVEIKIFNSLEDNIDTEDVITNADAYDMVVNKTRNLSSDYIPGDLVPLNDIPTVLKNPEINQLREVAYDALKELFIKAEEEKSFKLYARSGYRSYNTQDALYNSYVANHGQLEADTFSAKPGQSEHQSGLSIDITCEAMNFQLEDTFFDTAEGKWVADNAHRFGFIIRYPKGKESITGYQYEPWHLRYVGKTLATEIYESQLTIEEYFEKNAEN